MNQFNSHLSKYNVPKNINGNWNLGFILGMVFMFQIISGMLLTLFYYSFKDGTFDSVRMMSIDSNFGWYIHLYHSISASVYFALMFAHIIKGIWYSSKHLPWSWYTGIVMLLLSIAVAFMGYVLPDGQMSFWGATVIKNLMEWMGRGSTIAFGSFTVGPETLKRFFLLHFTLPFVILAILMVHIYVLHRNSSTNPISQATALVAERFFPSAFASDVKMFAALLPLFGFQMGYGIIPIFQSDPDNSIVSDPMVTPNHIIPEWYLLLFYAALKVLPTKTAGLLSILVVLEALIMYTETRGFTNAITSVHYHRTWSVSSVLSVPYVFVLGFLGKMIFDLSLIVIGSIITITILSHSLKIMDTVRQRH